MAAKGPATLSIRRVGFWIHAGGLHIGSVLHDRTSSTVGRPVTLFLDVERLEAAAAYRGRPRARIETVAP